MTIELEFHPGCPDGLRLKSLVREFVRVIQDEDIVVYHGSVYLEIMPTMFVAKAFGLYFPPWPDPNERWVQVAGIDCLSTPAGRKRCEELAIDPGEGPWPARFLRNVSHELGHALGLQDEGVTWDCGDRILSEARTRSSALRAGTRPE